MQPFINVPGDRNVSFHAYERPIVQLAVFALAYREAARALVKRFAAEGYADYDGYPILYLYRHALELYLKAVVYRGASLLGLLTGSAPETKRLFEHHQFAPLLAPLRTILATMKSDIRGAGFRSFDEFETFLRTLDGLDPGSYTFRYPVNRQGIISTPQRLTINVVAFANVCDPLLDYLEGVVEMIDDHWHSMAKAQSEIQQFLESDGQA